MADEKKPDWGVSSLEMWSKYALERLKWERIWMDRMAVYGWKPKNQPLLTRWQRIRQRVAWWFEQRRVALAKWIAGDEWPDEY
jgi:hypothetical protein